MSTSTNNSVDAAFERMYGYKWGASLAAIARKDSTSTSTSTSTSITTLEAELCSMFGPTRTARLLARLQQEQQQNPRRQSRERRPQLQRVITKTKAKTTNYAKRSISKSSSTSGAAKAPFKRRRIDLDSIKDIPLPFANTNNNNTATNATKTETVVFAGQTVTAKTKAMSKAATTTTTASKAKKKASKGNIDAVLSQLNGPTKVSTVQKTNDDWEAFKETDKQLQDELEQQAQSKDAFLVKQDFLGRVDHRKFALEKDKRDQERAKRAMPG